MQVFTLFSKFKKALTRAILAFIATIIVCTPAQAAEVVNGKLHLRFAIAPVRPRLARPSKSLSRYSSISPTSSARPMKSSPRKAGRQYLWQ